MSWFLVGATALSVVGSAVGQQSAKKKLKRQASEENARRADANLKNTVRAGYRTGLLNLQEGLYAKNATQQGYDTTAAKSNALGQVEANAAATGTVGASVDAVSQDIDARIGQMFAQREDELDLQAHNFDLQRTEIQYDLDRALMGEITADVPSGREIWTNAALAGAGTYLSSRASSSMRLGAGTKSEG